MMRTAEIRQRWLDYFGKQDHELVPSTSLISPDPSLLFTVAGMVPFIPYIIGSQQAPWPRAASVQKCIRTNDIDIVGRTTRHGTFFQMLGNFSFGDYFKQGAIDFAFELLTTPTDQGGYGLEAERLWITIWDQDDESYEHLTRVVGMDPKRIVRLPREENFWDTGQPGPAGPCAEIHYDRGPEFGPEAVGGTVDPGGDRYLEIWNLVFDQFLRGEGTGKDYPLIRELEQKAIDTGAGLERIAYLLQGKNNMYETDLVYPVIAKTEEITGKRYGAKEADDVQFRVIADHVRSALMLIGDGVRPANEGRGYVLRRLVRRAVRSLRLLGLAEAGLPELLPVSSQVMSEIYPEVAQKFGTISQVAYAEEEAFLRTLSSGTTILDTALSQVIGSNGGLEPLERDDDGVILDPTGSAPVLDGEKAFTLHDTYGFPIDLTLEIAAEQGVKVDEQAFRALMQQQKDRARADALAKKSGHADNSAYEALRTALSNPVEFVGYTDTESTSRLVGLLVDGVPTEVATTPAHVELVLDRTPFYAEAGGQLADHGVIRLAGGGIVEVDDVQSPITGLRVHRGRLVEGNIALGEQAYAAIDTQRRVDISKAHSATHLIHKALQETLGEESTQAGSENSPNRVRFDFRQAGAPPASALSEIEARVNTRLQENLDVTEQITSLARAKEMGAMALFGEKYGDEVRVVSIGGDWSRELCAGTHVNRSGEIGMVTLLGESSIGSGMRRVEALVGAGAYSAHAKERALVSQLAGLLNTRPDEVLPRVESLMAKLKVADKQLADLKSAQIMNQAAALAQNPQQVGSARVITHNLGDIDSADVIRNLVLDLRNRLGEDGAAVVAVAGAAGGRPVVVIATNLAAREAGIKAGALVRTAAGVLGGGGGGKDDLAQGGGQDPAAIDAALTAVVAQIQAAQ